MVATSWASFIWYSAVVLPLASRPRKSTLNSSLEPNSLARGARRMNGILTAHDNHGCSLLCLCLIAYAEMLLPRCLQLLAVCSSLARILAQHQLANSTQICLDL